jgi:hypothetical protein
MRLTTPTLIFLIDRVGREQFKAPRFAFEVYSVVPIRRAHEHRGLFPAPRSTLL